MAMRTDTSPGISTLRAVCAEPYGVWLDSSMAGGTLGARSFWAAEPAAVLRAWGQAALGLPESHPAFCERLHEIDPRPRAPAEPPALGREFPELRSTFTRP